MTEDKTGEILRLLNELIDLVKNNQGGGVHYHYHYPQRTTWVNPYQYPITYQYLNSGNSTS